MSRVRAEIHVVSTVLSNRSHQPTHLVGKGNRRYWRPTEYPLLGSSLNEDPTKTAEKCAWQSPSGVNDKHEHHLIAASDT